MDKEIKPIRSEAVRITTRANHPLRGRGALRNLRTIQLWPTFREHPAASSPVGALRLRRARRRAASRL